MYNKSKLGSAKAQLRIVSQSYGDMVRTFLFQVATFPIHSGQLGSLGVQGLKVRDHVFFGRLGLLLEDTISVLFGTRSFLGPQLFPFAHQLTFSVDLQQRRVSAVPQLQTGLQPALQEEGL